jgi:hypothetical protein
MKKNLYGELKFIFLLSSNGKFICTSNGPVYELDHFYVNKALDFAMQLSVHFTV